MLSSEECETRQTPIIELEELLETGEEGGGQWRAIISDPSSFCNNMALLAFGQKSK